MKNNNKTNIYNIYNKKSNWELKHIIKALSCIRYLNTEQDEMILETSKKILNSRIKKQDDIVEIYQLNN